jgi:hypothetical protein
MSDTGRRVRVDIEDSTKEATVVLASDNRKSLMLDLGGDGVRYRSGAILLNFLALLADDQGGEGDYICLITKVPAKVTWL